MDEKIKLPIGIDLGTTNSAVAVWWQEKVELVENGEGTRINPSYVHYSDDKKKRVGRMAREKGAIDPKRVLFDAKRLLATTINDKNVVEFRSSWPFSVACRQGDSGQKTYYKLSDGLYVSPEEVSSCILKSLLTDVCRRFDKKPDDIEAVITVPAYFNISQKRATLAAAELAGLKVRQLLSEPVAAALCYQLEMNFKDGEIIFTFDLGGGTFDVTIMEVSKSQFKVIALGGDSHLGGRDFDMITVKEMENRLARQLGNDEVKNLDPKKKFKMVDCARDTKEALSTAEKDCLNLSDIHPKACEEYLTREEFEKRALELRHKVKACCLKILSDAKLRPDQINHIVTVGGASKMTFVKEVLAEIFGKDKKISKTVSADESIAKGAAMYAAKLLGASKIPQIQNLSIQEALPFPIGVEIPGDKFKPILEHNSPIPSSNTIIMTTCRHNQTVAKIPIYEGFSETIWENTFLGELEVWGLPRGKAGSVNVEIMLKSTVDGTLQAEAKIQNTNIVVKTEIVYEIKFENFKAKNHLPVGAGKSK